MVEERRTVSKTLFERFDDTIELSLEDFIHWLREQASEFGGQATVRLEWEDGSYDESDRFEMSLRRPETDEEMAARIAEETAGSARYRAQAEADERARYERLKAKFEP